MTGTDPLVHPLDSLKLGPLRVRGSLVPGTGGAAGRYREEVRTDGAAILREGKDWYIRTDTCVIVSEGGCGFIIFRPAP